MSHGEKQVKPIDPRDYVTIQGNYAVINEGHGYAIIDVRTKRVIARNIASFLDCVKTLEYMAVRTNPQPLPITPITFFEEQSSGNDRILDELDAAFVKSLVTYFETMPDKIRHYYRDHHATLPEAEVIAGYYLKIASFAQKVKTHRDLETLVQMVEILKQKVSRYQHDSYKYRWSTGLEKEVLGKLRKIMDAWE